MTIFGVGLRVDLAQWYVQRAPGLAGLTQLAGFADVDQGERAGLDAGKLPLTD